MNNKKRFKTKESMLASKNMGILYNKMKNEELDDITVTFNHYDNTKRVVSLNKSFMENKSGTKLMTPARVIERLNTLKHDFHAETFVIQ